MIEDSIWESEFCKGFDPVQMSRALAKQECSNAHSAVAVYFESSCPQLIEDQDDIGSPVRDAFEAIRSRAP